MTEKVKKKTKATPKDETTEHPPQDASTNWHLAPPRNFPFTFCYVLGATVVSIGTGIGFASAHYIIAILICVLGVAIVVIGFILHKRAEREGERKPLNWRRVLTPILTGLLFICAWTGFLFLFSKGMDFFWNLGVNQGIERAKNETPKPYAPPTPNPSISPPTNATRELPDGRILLTDVTPEYFKEVSNTHTSIETGKLLEVYIDKWILITGEVANVANIPEKKRAFLTMARGQEATNVFFTNAKQIERIQPLKKGNPITVLCKIIKSYGEPLFWDCELTNER